jgi:ATP-dependent Clp protease, protease subunit
MDEHLAEDAPEQGQVIAVPKNIFIFGEINQSTVGNFLVAFRQADSKPGPITIHICSMGGWVEGGFAILDVIKSSKNLVTTVASGAIYSIAALIFSAGDSRIIYPSARMFFHPISFNSGHVNLNQVKVIAAETQRLSDLYCEFIANRSGLPLNMVQEMCNNETYLSAEECLANNLADGIIRYNKNKFDGQVKEKKAAKKKAKK